MLALEIVKVDITNPDLKGAVDTATLNLLVEDEFAGGGGCGCSVVNRNVGPGATYAPEEVNAAFAKLFNDGYRFARHAREIKWKGEDTYWIQWTLKRPGTAVLWAYEPSANQAVEVLQVHDK